MILDISMKFPGKYPEHTYQLDTNQELIQDVLRVLEDYVEHAEFHFRHVNFVKLSIDPFLRKQNDTMNI